MLKNKNIKDLFYKADFQKIIGDVFCILVFLLPLYFNLSTSEPFEFHKTTLVFGTAFLLFLLWALHSIQNKRVSFRKNKLPLLVLVFFTINIVSFIFSTHPYSSLWGNYWRFNGGIASLFCYILIFFIFITSLKDRKDTKENIVKSIVLSGLFVCLYALFQAVQYQSLDFRAISTFGQPNFLAAYLVFVTPLTVHLALKEKNRALSYSIFALAVLCFTVLLLTQSRAGWFGASMVSVATLVIFKKQVFQKRNLKYLLATLLLVFFLMVPFKEKIQERINLNLFTEVKRQEVRNGTLSLRLFAWEGALKTFLDYPIFGSGPETMFFVIPQYTSAQKNNHLEWDFRFDKAHNEPLDVLANTGPLSLIVYLALVFFTFIRLVKSKEKQDVFLGLSFLGLFGTNLFGFSCVTVAIYFWIAIAVSASQKEDAEETQIKIKKQPLILLLALIFLFLVFMESAWIKIYRANYLYSNGDYFGAVVLNPNLDYYRGTLAVEYLNRGDIDSALVEAEKAVALNPLNPDNYRVIFMIYKKTDPKKAIDIANNIIRLDPNNAQPYYEKGALLLEMGSKKEAQRYFEKALEMKVNYNEARDLLDKTK